MTVYVGLAAIACSSIPLFLALLDGGFDTVAQAENSTLTNTIDKTRINGRLKQPPDVLLLLRSWILVGLDKKQNLVGPLLQNNLLTN
jgi:hypothetical protein